MRNIQICNNFTGKNVDVKVIDEVINADYDSIENLMEKYPKEGDVPIIMFAAFKGESSIYRVKTPFEIANSEHPVFNVPGTYEGRGKWPHHFQGLELVARLSNPGEIILTHHENNENNPYPSKKADCREIVFGDYVVLLPILPSQPLKLQFREYPFYFIIGEENCKKQIEIWNVKDLQVIKDAWEKPIDRLDGIL